ncbi:MAG: cyclase family protein [Candidatus Caldarchaeum sp.]
MDFQEFVQHLYSLRVYDLGQPYFTGMPVHPEDPPFLMTIYKHHQDTAKIFEKIMRGFSYSLELIVTSMHSGTHIDALCHMAQYLKLYNGVSVSAILSQAGYTRYGADEIPIFVRRGILIDVAAHLRTDYLPENYQIEPETLATITKIHGISIGKGDAVLIRTGYGRLFSLDRDKYIYQFAGINERCAEWLLDYTPSIVGMDNLALSPTDSLKIHLKFLVEAGIYVIKNLNLEKLSADKIYEFILVVVPLNVPGATGSLVRPIALAPAPSAKPAGK